MQFNKIYPNYFIHPILTPAILLDQPQHHVVHFYFNLVIVNTKIDFHIFLGVEHPLEHVLPNRSNTFK